MNQGCLLKEAVVSRTLALIAAKRSNLSRGLQEAKAGSPRHLKAPLENWISFSTCRVVRRSRIYMISVARCYRTVTQQPGPRAQLRQE